MGDRGGRGVRAERVEVAVVGGGPAGALTAALLARLGHEVVLLERMPRWRWRACGVFTAPACVAALRRVGLGEAVLADVALPIPAMRVESRGGASFRLTYDGSGSLADSAVGFDRERLDASLLGMARSAGARVELGSRVEGVSLEPAAARLAVLGADGDERTLDARVVVGADGLRSIVATAAGVARPAPFRRRAAISFHIPAATSGDATMDVLDDGYVGLAPVPGGRLNVGIVLGGRWIERLRTEGAAGVANDILRRALPKNAGSEEPVEILDRVAGVRPASAAVARRAGDSWLLVGDAAGFLDPFTGEGLHRSVVSAELAATAIHEALGASRPSRLMRYDGEMRGRFATKDVVSRLVQGFLARPALFEYAARRLAARTGVRETMGRVIGDLAPASRALDPRFLAALLAP
jgi:flavin-dependent dehydrogenase